jgi:hypothetical protein
MLAAMEDILLLNNKSIGVRPFPQTSTRWLEAKLLIVAERMYFRRAPEGFSNWA